MKFRDGFKKFAKKYVGHPAMLFWSIGNELTAPWYFGREDSKADDDEDSTGYMIPQLFKLIGEMKKEARKIEGSNPKNFRPLTTQMIDIDSAVIMSKYQNSVDVWSINAYRGEDFATLFDEYVEKKVKVPYFITEFGADAYDMRSRGTNETGQADVILNLWADIEDHIKVVSGGAVFEFSDEWWKGREARSEWNPQCPDNDHNTHGICGYDRPNGMDNKGNTEWYGIFGLERNPTGGPNLRIAREVAYALGKKWNPDFSDDIVLGDEYPQPECVLNFVAESKSFLQGIVNDSFG